MNLIKHLLLIGMSSALTGCYLEVIPTAGGDIQSLSGARDCVGGSVCQFEVTDTNFNDSFTATAKPGYEFVRWQAGDGFQCADSTSPTCSLSNEGVEGHAGAEAVIASNQVFKIMPVFEATTSRYIVRDGNGDFIGEAYDIEDRNALVRLLYTDVAGVEHGYGLKVVANEMFRANYPPGLYVEATCTGSPTHTSLTSSQSLMMEPLFSADYRAIWYGYPSSKFSLARLSHDEATDLQMYSLSGGNCVMFTNGPPIAIPLTIVIEDLESQFPPPYTLHQE